MFLLDCSHRVQQVSLLVPCYKAIRNRWMRALKLAGDKCYRYRVMLRLGKLDHVLSVRI